MKKYKVTFIGEKKDAIGISYQHTIEIECNNEQEIKLKLYDTHDHIEYHTLKYEEIF